VLIELKGIGELDGHLPDTVNELEEDGGSLVVAVVTISVTQPLSVFTQTRGS
jgi:hypothetical protein